MTIIRATLNDAALAREAILDVHQRGVAGEATVTAFLRDESRYLLIAVEDGKAAGSLNGYALLHPHRPEPQFLLYEIDVRAEYRNDGIGRALVERFIEEARAAGAYEVWAPTNRSNGAAMAMYEHCGLRWDNRDDVILNLGL